MKKRALAPLLALLAAAMLAGPVLAGTPAKNLDPKNLSVEELAGQMLMVGFRGQSVAESDPIARAVRNLHLGGVVLFDRDLQTGRDRNVAGAEQLKRLVDQLQALAQIPLLVAVDQEGGKVRRLKEKHGFPPLPSHAKLSGGALRKTRKAARTTGQALAGAGINLDFAPVLDVAVNPHGPVIAGLGRSFGPDPAVVARYGAAFAQGLQQAGVATGCKHFPGHGSANADSHTSLPDVTGLWSPMELEPFRSLIQKGLCDTVMVAHLRNEDLDPALPTSLSPMVVTGLLRGQLGYGGVVVTDDLQMAAVAQNATLDDVLVLAVRAGADVLLLGNNLEYDPQLAAKAHAALVRAVAHGRLSRQRLEQSWQRIQTLKRSWARR